MGRCLHHVLELMVGLWEGIGVASKDQKEANHLRLPQSVFLNCVHMVSCPFALAGCLSDQFPGKGEGHKSCLRFCDLTRMTVDHDLNMIGLSGWQKLGKVQLSNEFMDTLTQTNQTNSSRIDCRQTIAVI